LEYSEVDHIKLYNYLLEVRLLLKPVGFAQLEVGLTKAPNLLVYTVIVKAKLDPIL
jgi:hypothetical protein